MKKFLILMLLVTVLNSHASAEQPAAEKYRQMFASGNFYVECQIFTFQNSRKMPTAFLVYAGKDGKRMHGLNRSGVLGWYPAYGVTELTTSSNREMLKFRETLEAALKKYPHVLYENGRYYRFYKPLNNKPVNNRDELRGVMLPEEKLNSPNLNPDEEWQYVQSDLALPDELAIFFWDDKFHKNPLGLKPYYNGSSKVTVDKKEYDCDQYLIDIKSMAGTNIAQEAYNALYENGQLVMVRKYLIYKGKERFVRDLKVIAITEQVPEEVFAFRKKIKVYEAGTGNLDDLVGDPKIIGEVGGKVTK